MQNSKLFSSKHTNTFTQWRRPRQYATCKSQTGFENSYEETSMKTNSDLYQNITELVKLNVLSTSNRPFGKLKIHFNMLSTVRNVFGTAFWL